MHLNVGDLQSRYSHVVRSFTDSFYSRLPVVVLVRPERVISNMYSSQIHSPLDNQPMMSDAMSDVVLDYELAATTTVPEYIML